MGVTARRVALVIALGLALRFAALWLVQDTRPVYDEIDYFSRSSAAAEGRFAFGEGKRPPLTVWYYTGLLRAFGTDPFALRVANVLLSGVSMALVWWLGRRFAGNRAGLVALVLFAVYPNLVFFASSLWSEVVYLPLALGALVALTAPGARPALILLSGVLMGGAALTREVGVMLPVVGAFWLPGRYGLRSVRAWMSVALLGVAFLAVVLPWSVQQNRRSGSVALITKTRWMNLYLGNLPKETEKERRRTMPPFEEYLKLGRTLEEREEAARPLALQSIRDRLPWWPLQKVGEMMPRLLTPNSLPAHRLLLRPGGAGVRSGASYVTKLDGTALEGGRDFLGYLAVAGWVAVLLAGTAGLALAWGRPLVGALLLFVGLQILPTIVTFAFSRYRLPFVPILGIGAGWLLLEGGGAWRAAGLRRRIVVVVSVSVAAWLVAIRWWSVTATHGG